MTKLTVTMMNTNNNSSPIHSPALSEGGDPLSSVHNNHNHNHINTNGSISIAGGGGGSYHNGSATTSSYHSNNNTNHGFTNATTTGIGIAGGISNSNSSRGPTPDATMVHHATDTLLFPNNSNRNSNGNRRSNTTTNTTNNNLNRNAPMSIMPMGEAVVVVGSSSSNNYNNEPVTDPVEALQQLNVELDRMVHEHEMNNGSGNGGVDDTTTTTNNNSSAFIKAYNASHDMFRDKYKRAFLMAENNVIKV